MGNKLSELSKPVAWTDAEELRGLEKHSCAYMFIIDPANPYHDPRRQQMLYSQEYVSALLADMDLEQGMRAQNLEIKTLLAEKVKTLETKLWDSQQLVEAKSGSQIELRSQISSLEESNRKDMAWRGERLCELEDSLEAAQKRISELEQKLATPEYLPALLQPESDAVNGMIFANGKNEEIAECSVAIRQAGFLSEASQIAVEGDE